MNARIAKDEVSILFPTNASYANPAADAERQVSQAHEAEVNRKFAGFGRAVIRAVTWVAELPRRRAVLGELQMMSNRELADIGLTRAELPHIFDAEFVAARNAARAKSAPVKLAQAA
jgi:uncharacterized protein YjiS (DUF1127 family)